MQIDPRDLKDIIDLDRYPIHEPNSPKFLQAIEKGQKLLKENGLCVLEGFIKSDAVKRIVAEHEKLAPQAFHNTLIGNCYLSDLDEKLPKDHARNMTDRTALAVVAYDQIDESVIIRKVYECDAVMRFVEKMVNRGTLYHYACPMGALNLTVMKDHDYLRWHFDQSDFVVSINLQDPDSGGVYEYIKDLRSPANENYEGVKNALEGKSKDVKILHANPGALILFEGRNTLHRVTEIKGKTPRYGALFGYALKPNLDSTPYLKKIRYGRTEAFRK